MTGAAISILRRSAGISWPLAPDAPEEELAAVAAEPLGAAEPLALPFAASDAAAAVVERPDVAALPDAFQAWARPMGWILEALR
jgi:hypothetical protein